MTPPDDMQPIETAPKDGTRIVIWRPGYGLYAVHWDGSGWVNRPLIPRRPDLAARVIPAHEATHWKPL